MGIEENGRRSADAGILAIEVPVPPGSILGFRSEKRSQHLGMPLTFVIGFRHQLESGRACGMHAHRDWELVYHPSGRGTTAAGAAETRFCPGDLVVYPPRSVHDQVMDEAGEDWCIHMHGFEPPAELAEALWCASVGGDQAIVAELDWLTSGFAQAEVSLARLRLEAVLTAALACWRRSGTAAAADPASELAERAVRLATERGHAFDGVAALARSLGVSADWLRHACALAGVDAPLRMLTRARLTRAQALLVHTRQPLAEVARQVGYRDARYLVAVFRRELGCTPGQLRAGFTPARRSRGECMPNNGRV